MSCCSTRRYSRAFSVCSTGASPLTTMESSAAMELGGLKRMHACVNWPPCFRHPPLDRGASIFVRLEYRVKSYIVMCRLFSKECVCSKFTNLHNTRVLYHVYYRAVGPRSQKSCLGVPPSNAVSAITTTSTRPSRRTRFGLLKKTRWLCSYMPSTTTNSRRSLAASQADAMMTSRIGVCSLVYIGLLVYRRLVLAVLGCSAHKTFKFRLPYPLAKSA